MSDDTTFSIDRDPITWVVSYRELWEDEWTDDANIFPTDVKFTMSPKIPTATLVRHYGQITTLGDGASVTVAPFDLAGHYIRIVLTEGEDTLAWYGYCPAVSDILDGAFYVDKGSVIEEVPRGTTTYSCYGLEWLLQNEIVSLSIKEEDGYVKRALPFNFADNDRLDKVVGNRTTAQATIGDFDIYEFSDTTTEPDTEWNGRDVVEHLLFAWKEQVGDVFAWSLADGSVDAVEELENIRGVWNFEGKNYYAAINEIINPGNAFSFHATVNEALNRVQIFVFPTVDEDIKEGSETIVSKNEVTIALQLDTDPDILKATVQNIDNAHYDEIEVRGGPLRVAFSVATNAASGFTDSILDEAWGIDEFAEYRDAADDEARTDEDVDAVYTKFEMPVDWSQFAGGEFAFPRIDTETGLPDPVVPQVAYMNNRVFERTLPFRDADNNQPKKPFAVYKDSENKWHRTEKTGDLKKGSVGMRVLDESLGIQLLTGAKPNHYVAEGSFTGSGSDMNPEWDYKKVIATVSMLSDEYARVVVEGTEPTAGDLVKTKIIQRPDLQVWFAIEGTVQSIIPGGVGDAGLVKVAEGGALLRDDSAKLQRVALLAASLYGKKRQRVDVTWGAPSLESGNVLGYFISEVQGGEASQPVDTIITEMEFSLGTNTQTQRYKTDFLAPNLSKIGRISGGGGLSRRQGSYSTPNVNELANIAAIPPADYGGSGGLDAYYFSASKLSDTEVQVSNIRYRYGLSSGDTSEEDVTVPIGEDGEFYIYFQALNDTAYEFSVEVSEMEEHPNQTNDGSKRAWREEIAIVTVSGGAVSSVEQIWPGHIMSIEGRVV